MTTLHLNPHLPPLTMTSKITHCVQGPDDTKEIMFEDPYPLGGNPFLQGINTTEIWKRSASTITYQRLRMSIREHNRLGERITCACERMARESGMFSCNLGLC